MIISHAPFAVILILGITGSVIKKKLSPLAALWGGILAMLIYIGIGYAGTAMMAAFFLLATFATSWKLRYKQEQKLAELNKGRRDAWQVLANAGMAAILSVLVLLFPGEKIMFGILIAAAFASATSDTLSSELGNVYGRRFYNIISFSKDKRGLDGVVSLEGTLFGILGSFFIAIIHALGFGFNIENIAIIVTAGTAGNLFDSLLGATVERKGFVNNNVVNFSNTLVAVIVAFVCFSI